MIMPSKVPIEANFAVGVETLISYVEVWLPNDEASHLRLVAAQLVGASRARKSKNQISAVAKGEGLAGRAWEQKSATLLQENPSDVLNKLSERCGTKLAAVMAIPVFCQQEIRGVVIIGLGDGFGAAEIWTRDDRDELAVTMSHYAGLPSFEFISRYTRFPKGAGVPGHVWKTARPQLLRNLGQSDCFIRSFGNDPAEISAAIGIPIGNNGGFPAAVLLLLSARATPLAASTEMWDCETTTVDDVQRVTLTAITGVGAGHRDFDEASLPAEWEQTMLDRVSKTGGPMLIDSDESNLPGGATISLMIPIFKNSGLTSVLNFLF